MDKNIPILQSNENKEYDGATRAAAEFTGDINDNKGINTNFNGAKHSLSKDVKICQTLAKSCINKITPRGAGWGTPTGLGLRGGGETSVANGATGLAVADGAPEEARRTRAGAPCLHSSPRGRVGDLEPCRKKPLLPAAFLESVSGIRIGSLALRPR